MFWLRLNIFNVFSLEQVLYRRVEEHLQEEVGDEANDGKNAEFLDGRHKCEQANGQDGDFGEEILSDIPALTAEALRNTDLDVEVCLRRHNRLGKDEHVLEANGHDYVREHLLAVQWETQAEEKAQPDGHC